MPAAAPSTQPVPADVAVTAGVLASESVSSQPSPASGPCMNAEQPIPAPAETATHADRIAALFHAHNEALIRFLAARLHSRQEALEVAQEAYVRMLNLAEPGAIGFLRAFLFRTAANLAVDRMRADSRARHARNSVLLEELIETRTPERYTVGAQEIARLRECVGSLPPKCRYAFLLYRVQGVAIDEVARRMGLTERMVHLYVRRALEACHRVLGPPEDSVGSRTDKESTREPR